MNDTVVRVGIVGAGANTKRRHIPGLREIDGIEITHVCNRSRSSSEKAAREFNITTVCDDWRKLVESDYVDAVTEMACGAQAHFWISNVTPLAAPADNSLSMGFGGVSKLRGEAAAFVEFAKLSLFTGTVVISPTVVFCVC